MQQVSLFMLRTSQKYTFLPLELFSSLLLLVQSISSVPLLYKRDFDTIQEVSSMLLDKLVAAGIGDRPVVFVTHRFV